MRKKLAVAAVVLLLGMGTAGATTLLEMDFSSLAREADAIVVGTVTSVDGEWDPSLSFVRSNVTVQVERTLRGPEDDTITLRTLGGFVGGVGQKAEGAAEFNVGERVLVFLTHWEDGTPKVLGYAQGKSRIVRDDLGGERLLGGTADGRSFQGALREIERGPNENLPLRPVR